MPTLTRRCITLIAASLLAVAAGCSTAPTLPPAMPPTNNSAVAAPIITSTWSADTLFDLLTGEIAGHRGQLDVSITALLRQARVLSDPILAARAARIAWYARSPERIQEATTLWATLAPDSPEANANAVMGLILANDIEAATPLLDHLLTDPARPRYLHYIVQYAQEAAPTVRTRIADMLASLSVRHAKQSALWLARAQLAEQTGDQQQALEYVRQARQLDSAQADSIELEGRLLADTDNLPAARKILKKGSQLFPQVRSLRLTHLQVLLKEKREKEARQVLHDMLGIWPEDGDLTLSLALLEWETGHAEQALQRFIRLAESDYRADEAWIYAGRIALAEHDYLNAASFFQNVRGAQFPAAQVQVAYAWQKIGRLSDARLLLATLQQRLPEAAVDLQIAASELEWRAGDGAAALAILDQALQQNPATPNLLYARAMTAERLGYIDMVERDIRAILAQQPNSAMALNALGYTLTDRTDRHAEAKTYIERALALAPNEAAIVDSMGWVLFRLGRAKEAIPWLQRAWALSPDPEIAAHLGEALWATGQHRAARRLWQRALRLDPDNITLQNTMERHLP